MYFDQYLSSIVIVLTFALSLFKLTVLVYPAFQWTLEFLILLTYAWLSYMRVKIGMRANRVESPQDSLIMIVFACASIIGTVYFVRLQTYM